eukprot:1408544-Amphidinium_carterae.2
MKVFFCIGQESLCKKCDDFFGVHTSSAVHESLYFGQHQTSSQLSVLSFQKAMNTPPEVRAH